MQLLPPWWGTWASGLLLRWQLRLGMYSVGFFFFFFLLVMLPSEIPKLPTDPSKGFLLWKLLLLHNFLPRLLTFVSVFFFFFYFVLPPFEENGLPFWVPGVLCQHCFVEVVQHPNELLMNLWERKWSPVLFLRHLGTAPRYFSWANRFVCVL